MNFRKFLKQWLGYSRRERTGSMVLIVILVVVLGIRMLQEKRVRMPEVEALPGLAAGDSVPGENVKTTVAAADPRQGRDEGVGQSQYSRGRISHSAAAGDRDGKDGQAQPVQDQRQQESYFNRQQGKSLDESRGTRGNDSGWLPRNDTRESPRNGSGEGPAAIDTPGTGLIDLNSADSAVLEALPGIGPVLSVRIIKYRYLLGCFHSVDQLKDVYGLDVEVIEMNRHRFTCDTGLLRKIYINSASYRDLLRHPYIEERQVEAIMSHRQLYGPLKDIPDLIANRIFTTEEMSRLKPYLDFR